MLYDRAFDSQSTTDRRDSRRDNPIDSLKKWFRGLAIGHKIGIGYGISIGIAVLGTTCGHIVSRVCIEDPAWHQHEKAEQKLISLNLLKDAIDRRHSDLLPYLENPHLVNLYSDDLLDGAERLERSFSQLPVIEYEVEENHSDISAFKSFLDTYISTSKLYKKKLEETLEQLKSISDRDDNISYQKKREIFSNFLISKEILDLRKLENDLDKLAQESRLEFRLADAAILQADILQTRVMYTSLFISVTLAILFGYYTSLAIARPLRNLTLVSQKATQTSNFDLKVSVSSNDEVGILATSFNNLIERLKHLLEEEQQAKEQLEKHIQERTEQLEQKSTELTAIIEAFPDLFFRHAADGKILNFKMGCQNHDLYLPPEYFLGKHLVECLPPTIAEKLQEAIAETVQNQCLNSVEYALPMPKGEQYYEARFVPVATEEVIGVVRNISDRKAAEIALRASEQKYKQILDAITDMVVVKGENSRIVWANRSFREFYNMTDRQLENLIDEPFNEPDFTINYIKDDLYVFQTGKTLEVEEPITRYDGIVRQFSTIKSPIINEEGTIILTVGVSRDISDRKAAEDRLRQSELQTQEKAAELTATLKELQSTQTQMIQSEKMSSLGQMVAGVAHEINNPVSFVHGNLVHTEAYTQDLLHLVKLYQQHFTNPPEEIKAELEAIDWEFLSQDLEKTLKSMRFGTERIRDIVLSLRNFSRLDEADFKDANLHEGIDNTLMILQNRLKGDSKHPEIQILKDYGNLPLIECYPGQLNQVFMNVLSNAIDALEEFRNQSLQSQIPPTIAIRTTQTEDNWVEIQIADNGIGIPEHVRSKLFDPFFTTKAIGKGTGLGLSISYQIIVERHGGKFSCHSNIGRGTEFIIEIPIRQYVG